MDQWGPGIRRTPPHTGCLWSPSAQHPASTQVTPIVSTWVLALGRVLETISPGPCCWLSPPGWHARGGSLGRHRGHGRGWAAPAVWPEPGTSALWAIDSHLQWGFTAPGNRGGPWHTRGMGTPHPNSQAGRAATEAVTRLLTPRVLRVPRRRPQVKARNWGRGTRVTVGRAGGANTPGPRGLEGSQQGAVGPPPSPRVLDLGRGLYPRPESRLVPWALPPGTADPRPSGQGGGSCCPAGHRSPGDRGGSQGAGVALVPSWWGG